MIPNLQTKLAPQETKRKAKPKSKPKARMKENKDQRNK